MLPLNSFIDGRVEMAVRPQDWAIKILKLKHREDKISVKNAWKVSLLYE